MMSGYTNPKGIPDGAIGVALEMEKEYDSQKATVTFVTQSGDKRCAVVGDERGHVLIDDSYVYPAVNCVECGNSKLFDRNNEERYCPVCEE